VIITTGRIRRTLGNKVNLLVDSPRSIEASRLALVKEESIFLHRAFGCFGTSHDLSRDSSSTTSPRAGSSSTTSPTPHVRVSRHVVWLVTRLVVDYFASCRLVVDYFAYAARPGASVRRAARHAARRRLLRLAQARRRLLHLRRVSGCFSTSRGFSLDSSSTTSPRAGSSSTTSPTPRVRVPRHVAWLVAWLVVDYFASASRPGASARRAARRRLLRLCRASGCFGTSHGSLHGSSRGSSSTTLPRATHRRLLRLAQARRRLLRLRRASGCFGTSRDSSRGSSSTISPRAGLLLTTSPTPRVRVPRHIARLVTRLVFD
jgi:hypothetical protein